MPRVSRFWARLAVLVALAGLACHGRRGSESPEESAPLRGWHYTVSVDAALEKLDARVCFEGRPPARLIPGRVEAAGALLYARAEGSNHELRRSRRGRALGLDTVEPGGCMRYGIDLGLLTRGDSWGRSARRTGDSLMLRTSLWLWRPDLLPKNANVTLEFELPPSVAVSVPWPTRTNDPGAPHVLDQTTFNWLGYTVLGHFDSERLEIGGAQTEIVILDHPLAASKEGVRAWITDAMEGVTLLYGKFPTRQVQVIVQPARGGWGSVLFGQACRGGGASVMLILDSKAQDGELPGGWTTIHEFLHLGMPFAEDKWMGEGFASYYTEIIRTRLGHRDEHQGWLKLEAAFARGRRGGRGYPLGRTSENMYRWGAFQRVYWGGAAIAFMADVQMRIETKGEKSFDDAMRELHRCCRFATHQWPADELLARLDDWYGRPLFSTLARRMLQTEFPPVEQAYEALGVRFEGGEVVLDDAHPNAEIRRGLMRDRSSGGRQPGQ